MVSCFIIYKDFQEGHPLSVLLKSVAEQNRIITVSIDEKEIEQAMVSFSKEK